MTNTLALKQAFESAFVSSKLVGHRLLSFFNNSEKLANTCLTQFIENKPNSRVLCIGVEATGWLPITSSTYISAKQYRHYLGHEFDLIIFNGKKQFHPDAFAALAGTLRAGGLFVCTMPAKVKWSDYTDEDKLRCSQWPEQGGFTSYFLCRLKNQVESFSLHNRVLDFNQDDETAALSSLQRLQAVLTQSSKHQNTEDSWHQNSTATAEQAGFIDLVSQIKDHQAFVLTADRGRGKSSVLGMAIAKIKLLNPEKSVIVTAPRKDCVAQIQAWQQQGRGKSATLPFFAIDEIITKRPKAQCLIIDEAAAIPFEQLKQLTEQYPQIIIATTLHGYEGSGQGFSQKFMRFLAANKSLIEYKLYQPIRWQQGDKLERFCNQAFLLATEQKQLLRLDDCDLSTLTFNRYSKLSLLNDEKKLCAIFSLLIEAHYQTTPADLRYIMDSPNLIVFTAELDDELIAVSLISKEGNIDADLALEIARGRRRVAGHLTPQTIAAQLGEVEFCRHANWRVVRIAVLEQFRQQHIASKLLAYIEQQANNSQISYMATSFGAAASLVNFWQQNDYQLVRLGLSREKTTGEFSALMLKTLTSNFNSLIAQLVNNCAYQLSYHQNLSYQSVCREQLAAWQSTLRQQQTFPLLNFEKQHLNHFAFHFANLASTRALIAKLLSMLNRSHISVESYSLLEAIARGDNETKLVQEFAFTGKKQLTQNARLATGEALNQLKTLL
ncbi:tRNA(Met) cytidine acetyltransferase [Catenovulum sp. SM1970]|uniref:GNAT family N-acetyltransferase n=1 Tax=Marinifaba aquimaris TaxID=2741323 RepID=UPI001572A72A|nr:GNAT family N-acetyltransferase [Marinifaba aquimaris]NTS75604.1 tRNA(Met) cytidine acetyltransferase [Marinifaba aquimaris]